MDTATGGASGRRRRDPVSEDAASRGLERVGELERTGLPERVGTPLERVAIPASSISHTEIAQRAYQIFEARGCADGFDVDDWLAAERELASIKLE
jgi:Protein of unknown function (DUF2934)